jgi:AraC-like DNA-binding protein/mannose-6-phosphate isomerase-like protein (cupin superfamily)
MADNPKRQQTISQKQVSHLPLGSYDFVIHYAEMLNENTMEFRHSHSYYELFYVYDGELVIRFDDCEREMHTGDLMMVSANTPHHVQNIPGEKKRYFTLIFDLKPIKGHPTRQSADFKEVRQIDTVLKRITEHTATYVSAGWDAGFLLDQISRETSEKLFGWTTYANMLYYGFFIHALRYIVSVEPDTEETDLSLNLAIETTKYIHAHYSEDISLETLATSLFISPRHANRLFRKMFGTTFGKTLRMLRLTYAKSLLQTTDLSVDDIAERVGFSSAGALRKIFKQAEGITISQYKSQL